MPPWMRIAALVLLCALPAYAGEVEAIEAKLQSGDLPGALSAVTKALAAHPADIELHELRIDIFSMAGQIDLVSQVYRDRAQSGDLDALYLSGRAARTAADSLGAYERVLSANPRHARAWMGKGAVKRAQGASSSAAECYQQALTLDPSLGEAWAGLYLTQLQLDDPQGALATARQAILAAPQEPTGWLGVAALAPKEAVATLDKAARALPTDAKISSARARAHFEAQSWASARSAYVVALSHTPLDRELRVEAALVDEVTAGLLKGDGALRLLAVRSLVPKRNAEAITLLDGVVAANPRSGWARLVRGNLRSSMSQYTEAERDLTVALQLMPQSADIAGAWGLFLLGRHRAAEALPHLERAATATPWDPSLNVAYGMAALEAGKPDEAKAILRATAAAFPTSATAALALSRVLSGTGDVDGAIAALITTMRANPDPTLAAALGSIAISGGRVEQAAAELDKLGASTGDARYGRAAQVLRNVWNTKKSSTGSTPTKP
jgi:Tfp pilus assembly protein PilF